MPLYEFECEACGTITEKLLKLSDPKPENCEHCTQGSLKKIVSRTHFVLKGQGWYETDFKNKSSKKASSTTVSASDAPASTCGSDAATGSEKKCASGACAVS